MSSSIFDEITSLAVALGDGVHSVGMDIYLGAQRTSEILSFDNRSKEIWGETLSLLRLLERTFNSAFGDENNPLYKCIEIILKRYYDKLPDSVLEYLSKKARLQVAYTTGRMFIGAKLAKKTTLIILTSIVSSHVYKMLAKKLGVSVAFSATGVGATVSILMLQGLLQRSSLASLRLHAQCPEIYIDLKKEDLHLLYFLVESAMEPYIKACKLAEQDLPGFRKAVEQQYNLIFIK